MTVVLYLSAVHPQYIAAHPADADGINRIMLDTLRPSFHYMVRKSNFLAVGCLPRPTLEQINPNQATAE